jgi:ferritin-like metal-binding protein YciE
MTVRNPEELFVWMLSDVRQREDRAKTLLQEIGKMAEEPDIKEIIDQRLFIRDQIVATLDQCFKVIGKQPVPISSKLHDVFLEDFQRELKEIESPMAKGLYIRAKLNQLMHLHIGEYTALTAMADMSGHYGAGVLLETCLADNMAFVERSRRAMRKLVESKMEMARARA